MEAQDKARWTWHLISWVAPVSFGILFLVLMVALIGFEPFIFVIAIITLVAGYVGRRFPRRAGPITVAAVMTLLILGNLPALIDDLAHPDSFVGFALFGVVAVAFALAAIIASIAILIGRPDDGATPGGLYRHRCDGDRHGGIDRGNARPRGRRRCVRRSANYRRGRGVRSG